jgi:hypothetical protein
MKAIIPLIITMMLLSCTEKDDISDKNKQPVVYVSSLDGGVFNYFGDNNLSTGRSVVDTIKLMDGHYANFIIKIQDEHYQGIKKTLLVKNGEEYEEVPPFDQNESSNVHYDFSNSDTVIIIECKNLGTTLFSLDVTDSYGLTTSAHFDVNVVENVTPSALFSSWNSRGLDPHEITIDASASRDWQEKWGGEIVLYEYYLDGDLLTQTDRKVVKYIVPEAGNYKVDVKVKDNENLWSVYHTGYQSAYVAVND